MSWSARFSAGFKIVLKTPVEQVPDSGGASMGNDSGLTGPAPMVGVASEGDDGKTEGMDVESGGESVESGGESVASMAEDVTPEGEGVESGGEDVTPEGEGVAPEAKDVASEAEDVTPMESSSEGEAIARPINARPIKKARKAVHARFADSDADDEAPKANDAEKPEDNPEDDMDSAVFMKATLRPTFRYQQLTSYIIHHAKNDTLHAVKTMKTSNGKKPSTLVTVGIPNEQLHGVVSLKSYVESHGSPLIKEFYKSFPDLLQMVLTNAKGAFVREFSSKNRGLKPADFLHMVSRVLTEYTATRKKTADEANEILEFFDDFVTADVIRNNVQKSKAARAAQALADEVPAHDWDQTRNSYLFAQENLEGPYIAILSSLDKDRMCAEYAHMQTLRQNILTKMAWIGMEPQEFERDCFESIAEFQGASPDFVQRVRDRWEMASSLRAQRAPAPSPDASAKNLGNLVDKNDTDAIIQLMRDQPLLLAAIRKATAPPTRAGQAAFAYAAGPAVAAAGPAVAAAELEGQAAPADPAAAAQGPAAPAAEAEGPAAPAASASRNPRCVSVGLSEHGFQLTSVPVSSKVTTAYIDVALPDDTFVITDSQFPVEILQRLKDWVSDAFSANAITEDQFEDYFFFELIKKLISILVVNNAALSKLKALTTATNAALRDHVLRSIAGGYVANLHGSRKMTAGQYIEAMTKLHASTFARAELYPKEYAIRAFQQSFLHRTPTWNLLSLEDASDVHAAAMARFEARHKPA